MKSTLRFSDKVRSMIQSHGNKVNGSLETSSKSGWIDSLHFKYLKSLYSVNELGIVTFRNLRDLDLFVNRISYLLKNAYSPSSIVDNLFGCGCNKTFVSLFDMLEEKRTREGENLFNIDNLDLRSDYIEGFPYQLLLNARSELIIGDTYYGRFTPEVYIQLKNYIYNKWMVQTLRQKIDEDDFKGIMNEIIPHSDIDLFYPFNSINDYETGYHFTMDGNNPNTIQLVVDNIDFHNSQIGFDNTNIKGGIVKMPPSFWNIESNSSATNDQINDRNITIVSNFDHKLPIKLKRKAPNFNFFLHDLKTLSSCSDNGNIDIKFVLGYFGDFDYVFLNNNTSTATAVLYKLKLKFDIQILNPSGGISKIVLSLNSSGGSASGYEFDKKEIDFPQSNQPNYYQLWYSNTIDAILDIKVQDYVNIITSNGGSRNANLRLVVFDNDGHCKVFVKQVKFPEKVDFTDCCTKGKWKEKEHIYFGTNNMLRMTYTASRQSLWFAPDILVSKTELHLKTGPNSWTPQNADYCDAILDGVSGCDSDNLSPFYIHDTRYNISWAEALHGIQDSTHFKREKVKHYFATAYGGGTVNKTVFYPQDVRWCVSWI